MKRTPKRPARGLHWHAPTVQELPNGLRAVHREHPATRLVHVAVVIDCGGRDDPNGLPGLAHFLEHMVFKGTRKRKAFHILNRLDVVGGDLNAYTDKEKTVYHATVTREHAGRALELLADMLFAATHEPREINKERQVIADEIDSYADSPEDMLLEWFDTELHGDHMLGAPILGTRNSLAEIDQTALQRHIARAYHPERMVVSTVGALTTKEAQRLVAKHFGLFESASPEGLTRTSPPNLPPQTRTEDRDATQAYWLLGGPALPIHHPLVPAFWVLNNHLGGNAMNTVLNYGIREKYGLGYNLYSFWNGYTDGGSWGVVAGLEPDNLPRLQKLVHRELKALRENRFSPTKLARVKQQFIGLMAISLESPQAMLMGQAKDLLDFGSLRTEEAILMDIENVTAEAILEVANQHFEPATLFSLAYQPAE